MPPPSILIIDDDPADRALTVLVLRDGLPSAQCIEVTDGVSFADRLAAGGFDMVIAETSLRWGDGLEALRLVHRRFPEIPRLAFCRHLPTIDPRAARESQPTFVQKDSAGYVQLPQRVAQEWEDARSRGEATAMEQLLEGLASGLVVIDDSARVVRANRSATALLARPERSLEGLLVAEVFPGLQSDPEWGALREGHRRQIRVQLATPNLPCGALDLHLWRDLGPGRPLGRIGILISCASAASELPIAGDGDLRKDLEQLAYAVSHDLQEPLQLINRNARLLSTRCGEQIDPDARRFLDHLINSGERLQGMLDGLLSYSRLGFGKGQSEKVDMNTLVQGVLADLDPLLAEAGAEVQRERLPEIQGDPTGLRQLYLNLIGNAIKFRGQHPLRITLGAQEDGAWWRFVVKDNGIGVDPRFQENIFGMFQRLHTESEYPGTGIGLAICKKIVEQYGGSIWVKSQPDEGAAFYFTLPRDDQGSDSRPES